AQAHARTPPGLREATSPLAPDAGAGDDRHPGASPPRTHGIAGVAAKRRIVVALSGASGAIYGIRSLEALRADPSIEIHAIVSKGAHATIEYETQWKVPDGPRPRPRTVRGERPRRRPREWELPDRRDARRAVQHPHHERDRALAQRQPHRPRRRRPSEGAPAARAHGPRDPAPCRPPQVDARARPLRRDDPAAGARLLHPP